MVNVTKILKKEPKITEFIPNNHKKTTLLLYYVLISLLLLITPQMIDGASHLKYLQNLGWILGVPHDWVQIDGKTADYQSPSGGERIALYDTAIVPCTTIDSCVKSVYDLNINRGFQANSLQISDHTVGGFPSKILMGPNFYYIFTAANGLIYTLIFKGTIPVTFEYNVFDIKEQIRMQNNLYELMRHAIRCTWPYYCVPSYR